MKIWMHILATIVGLLAAGLIVFIVFGNASREGATQDGDAPGVVNAAGTSLCGKVTPSDALSPASLAKVPKHLPTILDPTGKQIGGLQPEGGQQAWLARIVASAGFCLDEIDLVGQGGTYKLSMSTVKSMSEADAAAFTGAALVASFARPLNRPAVTMTTFVGNQKRTIRMTQRAAGAFAAWRRAHNASTSVTDLITFSRSVRLGSTNLQILGWT